MGLGSRIVAAADSISEPSLICWCLGLGQYPAKNEGAGSLAEEARIKVNPLFRELVL